MGPVTSKISNFAIKGLVRDHYLLVVSNTIVPVSRVRLPGSSLFCHWASVISCKSSHALRERSHTTSAGRGFQNADKGGGV